MEPPDSVFYFNICRDNWAKILQDKDSENRAFSFPQKILNTFHFFPSLIFYGLASSYCWIKEHVLSSSVKKTHQVGIASISQLDENKQPDFNTKPSVPFSDKDREKHISNSTLPSFSEICSFISYDKNQPEIIPPQLVKNADELMNLLDPETKNSYEEVNKNVHSLDSKSEEILKSGIYFVHVTLDPIGILDNGINNKAVSMSLFDTDPNKPGLYDEQGREEGYGLIYEVPPVNIVAAGREDLQSVRSSQTEYIIKQYQCKIIRKYISRLWHQSKFYKDKPKKQEILLSQSLTNIRHMNELIKKYEENIINMTPEEKATEFKKLFGREGTDIIKELLIIQNFINANKFQLFSDNRIGKHQNIEKLTSLTKSMDNYNEVFVLTPSTSTSLGIKPPQLKAVLLFRDSIKDKSIKERAQELKIPVYSTPSPFYRNKKWIEKFTKQNSDSTQEYL